MMRLGAIIIVLCVGAFVLGTMSFSQKVCASNSCAVADFKKMVDSGEYKIIDIRTADEYAAGHLANSVNVDWYQTDEFIKYTDSLDKNGKYLIYCRTGNRSGQALKQMREKGFLEVRDLSGGITAWTSAGLSVTGN